MDREQLKIDIEPLRVLITSEPYVIYTVRGYQAVVDVFEKRKKREYYMFVTARSIADPIENLRVSNSGRLTGIEVWIRKSGSEKTAKYIVEE